jgi:hypothetical protein
MDGKAPLGFLTINSLVLLGHQQIHPTCCSDSTKYSCKFAPLILPTIPPLPLTYEKCHSWYPCLALHTSVQTRQAQKQGPSQSLGAPLLVQSSPGFDPQRSRVHGQGLGSRRICIAHRRSCLQSRLQVRGSTTAAGRVRTVHGTEGWEYTL